jgi:hypothetical protein
MQYCGIETIAAADAVYVTFIAIDVATDLTSSSTCNPAIS